MSHNAIFKLPESMSTDLDKINQDFFWKKSNTEKCLTMVSWDKVCHLKRMGGLGLLETKVVNKAFLCKLSWRYLTEPNNFGVKNIRAKYPLTLNFFTSIYKCNDSWL